ncbi:MAG: tRNA (adenosine(37)-N6)-dimethylallyltransferase MiaA, partial [Acidimicrobiales bacterium]
MVALVGPTASGKSRIAVDTARASIGGPLPIELVSVDSMAVYRGMEVGTAKLDAATRAEVAVHVVDLVDPDEEFTVQQFQSEAGRALEGISSRRHGALLVGGTGLY